MSKFIEKLKLAIDVDRIIKMNHGLESVNVGRGTKRKRPLFDVGENKSRGIVNIPAPPAFASSSSSSSISSCLAISSLF
jgi:hypothetical protein